MQDQEAKRATKQTGAGFARLKVVAKKRILSTSLTPVWIPGKKKKKS